VRSRVTLTSINLCLVAAALTLPSADRTIDASFIALPAAAFTVDGPRAASDAARIDAGAKLAVAQNAWVFASFDGEFSSGSQSYAGKAGAKVNW
jgi:uncharacterized protein with beta-barrel porin domain